MEAAKKLKRIDQGPGWLFIPDLSKKYPDQIAHAATYADKRPQGFPFLKLPAELRSDIYNLYFQEENGNTCEVSSCIDVDEPFDAIINISSNSLFAVSRLLRSEAIFAFFAEKYLLIYYPWRLLSLFAFVDSTCFAAISHIRLHFHDWFPEYDEKVILAINKLPALKILEVGFHPYLPVDEAFEMWPNGFTLENLEPFRRILKLLLLVKRSFELRFRYEQRVMLFFLTFRDDCSMVGDDLCVQECGAEAKGGRYDLLTALSTTAKWQERFPTRRSNVLCRLAVDSSPS
ncbi:hypothetical protein EJ08DRAFT_695416 [Tothia fuscella]|uniref:Uncharacterized protein n=1 Tax=Tothia fuscella TaxID=1048955 RepID=A0A9P4U180_9PEZI|nr:hypothetical protein EJ08DRAFT_695416 [Tothia fuscella]